MKQLTLYERGECEIGSADNNLSYDEVEEIWRLIEDEIIPRKAFNWEYRKVRVGPRCGVVKIQQTTIEILPKIDDPKKGASADTEDNASRGVLVAMLVQAGKLKTVGNASLDHQKTHLLDIFIEDFCNQVKAALRRGVISLYIEKTDNLNAIRGRLELTEHLRKNAVDHSRLLCRFDERSIDNRYNQALKYVLVILLRHAILPETRAIVMAVLRRFDEVKDRSTTVSKMRKLNFNRTIKHWEPVFKQARWLLKGLYPDVRAKDGMESGSALLFNMEKLFEEVLGLRIQQACRSLHGNRFNVKLQGSGKSLSKTHDFILKPDITICEGKQHVVAILDAKWKFLETNGRNSKVANPDIYQMNAYASCYRCCDITLVYPDWSGLPEENPSKNKLPTEDHLITLDTDQQPKIKVVAVSIDDLANSRKIPPVLEKMVEKFNSSMQRQSR